MKALIYDKAHSLENFSIRLADVAEPTLRDKDVLVEIRAIGINPGEAWIRSTRSAEPGGRIVLGFEFAGVVVALGSAASGFAPGDRVYGTGDSIRDGAWAERLAVDHRIIAKIPDVVSFADAASLPIGSVTAWESLFRDIDRLPTGVETVLVIGAAGGVGSLATQLLRVKTTAYIIGTASRPESKAWVAEMGAELVLDHTGNIPDQLKAAGKKSVDMVFSTAGSVDNMPWIADVLRPFGHVAIVDVSPSLDVSPLVLKSASLHTEMVFSKILFDSDPETQGNILQEVGEFVKRGEMRPIATTHLNGLSAETMRTAHAQVETKRTIGKIVIEIH